jgi:glycosyltransferase involved in cell wall biosynthesis
MKILVITQRVDKNDPNLGFFHGWLGAFAKKFEKVEVIALGAGKYDLPANVAVHSLGKETGRSRIFKILKFYFLIWKLRRGYDRVFVHMNPEYAVLAGWFWKIFKKPAYLWYVHKSVTWWLKCAEKWVDKIFTANEASCRLEKREKIVVVGHGIDTILFSSSEKKWDEVFDILAVGRMSPVKKYEIILDALKIVREKSAELKFRLTLIVPALDSSGEEYGEAINKKIADYGLGEMTHLVPGTDHEKLPGYFHKADVFIHSSETGSVDKVVLEAMSTGLPVLTSSEAFDFLPENYKFEKGNAKNLADKIFEMAGRRGFCDGALRGIVVKNFSLENLLDKITANF